MSGPPTPLAEEQSYKCLWRTLSTYAGPSQQGEITVQARNLSNAIDVARYKVNLQIDIGTKNIVVYEVEEPFL